jgi:very-short-patch-repair endonuclease
VDPLAERLAKACIEARQHQATRGHLRSAGVGTTLLTRCVREQRILRLRRGAYALAPLPSRGRHLLSDGQVDLGYLAEVRSVLHSLGTDCAADRRTAALLWQMDMLVEPKLVEVRVPRSRTRVVMDGVNPKCSTSSSATLLPVRGLEEVSVTPAVDTVLDCCRDRPMMEAVVIADSALRRQLVTVEELTVAVAGEAHLRGVRKLRRLLTLIDDQSGSVLESILRFLLLTNGLRPQSQYVVKSRDGKRSVGRVDFCFEAERVVIECDGRRWHDPDDARTKDRHRDNGLARARWLVLRFTWDEVRNSAGYVLACVREALLPLAA